MRAVRFDHFGPIEGLSVVELPEPQATGSVAIVRVEAAAINPSDLGNVFGKMSQTTLPRVPGRDYAGVVEDGPADWVGARVWGTGGDAGFTRDGTHAQFVGVPAASLKRMPENLSFGEAAAVGVSFVTAWCGVVESARLREGETCFVIGAGGSVGGAAAQIAKRIGATVIAAARRAPPPGSRISEIAEHLFIDTSDLRASVMDCTNGKGADVIYDTVGGPMLRTALSCLANKGRLVEISARQPEVSFNLADFYHHEQCLFGVDSLKRDLIASSEILDGLRSEFERKNYRPQPIAEGFPLDQVVEAYRRVAEGANGKIVLYPHQ